MTTGKFMACDILIVNTRNIFPLAFSKVPVFGDFWSAFSNIQSECRKIWTRKTPNTDTFHALILTINLIRQGVNKLLQSRNKSELSRSSMFSSSNYMFARAIWYKLPECIFKNSKIAQKKTRAISKFSKIARVTYPKNCPNQTCGYWLITPIQQILCTETNIF